MSAIWTIRIERMAIHLPVGVYADELEPQPLWLSLTTSGAASASPHALDQCLDYEPLHHWLTHVWPYTPHTPLLETRINQLLGFVFNMDVRLKEVWVGLYKQRVGSQAVAFGIERCATRAEFEAQPYSAGATMRHPVANSVNHEKDTYAAISH